MRQDYPNQRLVMLCRLFGRTRHAWYDHQWRSQDQLLQSELVLQMVIRIRQQLPRIGTRKLYYMLQSQWALHGVKMGRDQLFKLLQTHHLLVRQRKRKACTTDSRHWMHKYSNLARKIDIFRPEQLWVSDMTYIRMGIKFGYLSLVTDAYSRKIVGFDFRPDLSTQGCVNALQMALNQRTTPWLPLVHHSDRGTQYCARQYVDLLNEHQIAISMTEKGDPYENALAERVNGIIKAEFDLYSSQLGFEQTKQVITQKIEAYNQLRPHASCDYLTPVQAHLNTGILKKRWKNYPRSNAYTLQDNKSSSIV